MHADINIAKESPTTPDVIALLNQHLANMRQISPPESVHALDLAGLCAPEVTFWTARRDGTLLGCGALKALDAQHGEIKSMRTVDVYRGQGVARAILLTIIEQARSRGYRQLSLETGSMVEFEPARKLYESAGFAYVGPFAGYAEDPNSVFMGLRLGGRDAQ